MNQRFRWTPVAAALLALPACETDAPPVEVRVPQGATLSDVVDSLANREIVRAPGLFELYARMRGAGSDIRAGAYALRPHSSWNRVIGTLTRGEVLTVPMTVPEGFRLSQIAPRIANISGIHVDSVMAHLERPELVDDLDVPGPTLEGYLFPDTYRFTPGTSVSTVVRTMAEHYHALWTPERREQLEATGMTEREIVTLASIIQAEARQVDEMPLISGVYHRRLDQGWLLQADPTVLYALGGRRERLLYAAIDSVENNPYNTYTQPGLPPGPIGAPGERAVDAALAPEGDFLYFVARPDGSHVFTRSLAEHNRAKAESQRLRDARDP
ncbi:MAG: endolytic transglycosylase MltG [Gemmatimonadota bacterium]|nr:endolytic transglycosylase MltG [Gemmatimonadota bacterium]